jgi:hypothetical protein
MDLNKSLLLGLMTAAALGSANASVDAQDGCYKWCGCGSSYAYGTRSSPQCSPPESCAWTACWYSRDGCWDGPYNDICGSPDWCAGC